MVCFQDDSKNDLSELSVSFKVKFGRSKSLGEARLLSRPWAPARQFAAPRGT